MPDCGELGPWGQTEEQPLSSLSLENVATTGITKCQPCLLETYQLYSEETIQADRLEEKRDIWTELQLLCFECSWQDSLGSWSAGPGQKRPFGMEGISTGWM